ncbi:fibroblast growth factor receptor-like [Antedon mediterranea]|uniref:fibroblast growth factor receptor-like n=1 Tax=Antedon mediterranea TaxID=105859 RepID=UPI003AF9ACF2
MELQINKSKNVPPAPPCPPMWRKYNGSCFLLSRTQLSWQGARQYCNKRNASLATIGNSDEQDWLAEILKLKENDNYWTAINDIEEEGVYRGTDGISAEYLKWDIDQPNNKGDCITFTPMVGGVMHDRDCAKIQPWLCEQSVLYTRINDDATYISTSKNTAVIVASTCSAVLVLVVIFAVLIVLRRRRRRSVLKSLPYKSNVRPASHDYLPQPIVEPAEEFKNMEIPRNRITTKDRIGGGQFGKVLLGHVAGIDGSGETIKVAIKCLRDHTSNKEDFLDEIRLLIELGKHKNIISLVGCVTISQPNMALFEFMQYGDLLQFLRKARQVKEGGEADDPIYAVSLLDQLNIARQIANGMDFVSSLKYYHGDLAARNVLVGENLNVKICDFGLAADIYQKGYDRMAPEQKRPFKWSSLETLIEGICTIKSDVWSYGVVLYEVFTLGAVPYPHINANTLLEQLKAGTRLAQPKDCPDDVYSLMSLCWLENSTKRPYFDEISNNLSHLLETHHQPEGYLDFNATECELNNEHNSSISMTSFSDKTNTSIRYVNDKIKAKFVKN